MSRRDAINHAVKLYRGTTYKPTLRDVIEAARLVMKEFARYDHGRTA